MEYKDLELYDKPAAQQPHVDPIAQSIQAGVDATQRDRQTPSVPDVETSAPSLGESALAWFQNETMLGQMAEDLRVWSQSDGDNVDFNPVRYAFDKENADKYRDIEPLVLQGRADHITNPAHFEAWVDSVRTERKNRQVIAETGTATNLGLGFLTGLIDAPSLATMGVGTAGMSAYRAGVLIGTVSAASTAATEGYLYNSQVDRTGTEALMSIGAAGSFGFLGGSVLTHLMSGTSLNKTVRSAIHDDVPIVEVEQGASLSAARAPAEETPTYAQRGLAMRAVDWVMDQTGITRSPATLAARSSLDSVRTVFSKVADIGIVDTKAEAGQRAATVAAEQYRYAWENYSNAATMAHDEAYRKALASVGDTAPFMALRSELPNGVGVKVSRDDFDREVFLSLMFKDYQSESPFADAVKESVGVWQTHYGRYLQEGRRLGVFSGANDTKFENFYLPQLWNRSKVAENPDTLKRLLYEAHQQQFDGEWLKDRYRMSMDEFEKLTPDQQQVYRDAFNQENDIVALERAEAKLGELQRLRDDVHNEIKVQSKTARTEGTREAKSLVRAIDYDGQHLATRREKYLADIAQLSQERDALANAGTYLRQAELARQEAWIDPPGGVDFVEMKKLFDRRNKAADDLLKFTTDPDAYIKLKHVQQIHGESKQLRLDSGYRSASAKFVNDFRRYNEEWDQALGRPKVAPEDPRLRAPLDDPRTQYLKGLADESDRQLAVRDRAVKRLEGEMERLEKLKAKYHGINAEAKAAAAEAKAARQNLARWKDAAEKALAQQEKKVEGIREKAMSTKDFVNELVRNITHRDMFPSGLLYDGALGASVTESGRVKHRQIDLTKFGVDGVRKLMDAGLLDTRLGEIAARYSRDLGGRLGLRENFGSEDLSEVWRGISDEFAAMADAARAKGDMKKVKQILAEEKRTKDMLSMMVDKELGRWDVNSAQSVGEAVVWFANMAKQANAQRFLGGSVLASFSDLATMSLQKNPVMAVAQAFGTNIEGLVREASSRQLASVLFAAENNPGMARYSQLYSLDDMYHEHGFGSGMTRKVTSGLEAATRYTGSKLNTLNFMRAWNGRMSFVAGHDVLSNILDAAKLVAEGKALDDKTLRDMAFVGLDRSDLIAMHKLNAEHSEEVVRGYRMPKMDDWAKTDEGFRMSQKLTMAIDKASRRAVIRPGTGDLPPFVSSFMGKLLFQFQSFAYASVNKWVRNMDRMSRASTEEGMRALASIAWSLAAGALVYTIRQGVINNKWEDVQATWNNPVAIAREAIDRGGLSLMFGPYLSGAMKIAAPHLDAAGIPVSRVGLAAASRFQNRTPLNDFAGPTWGLGEDIQKVLTSSDSKQLKKSVSRLLPFRNLFYLDWYANNLAY